MKKCETCRYGRMYELDKPCVVYREDCPLYEKEGDDMTREESIHILDNLKPTNTKSSFDAYVVGEAITMAIKALEKECVDSTQKYVGNALDMRCEDAISRQALDEIKELMTDINGDTVYAVKMSDIRRLPSVNPQEPCEVSEYDKDHIWYKGGQYISLRRFLEAKAEQEPKTDRGLHLSQKYKDWQFIQEPKTGHWIWCVGSHKCSNCEEYTCFSHKELLRYCPNCGAKMVEP